MCLAVPGRIESIEGDEPLARTACVRFDGVVRRVQLACVPEAKVGDHVIVHVGFAIAVVDEEGARRSLDLLEEAMQCSPGDPEAER